MMNTKTDYYCNQKFWWLSVDPQRKSIQSCCSANPEKIDLSWLEQNPGELFNSPGLLHERNAMLNNIPVVSCEGCWRAEAKGVPSRRIVYQSQNKSHTELRSEPEVINLNLGNDCNLTCSYCCKQYSTAWLRDITANGEYFHEDRYIINSEDRIINALGQKAVKQSRPYQLILDQVKSYTNCKHVVISGGEPFLYNGLEDIVSSFQTSVEVYTGLGVDTARFKRMVDNLPDTVTYTVSAENMGALYEFNRYGNSWDNFQRNLDILANKHYRFSSVISNTTIHGYNEFYQAYGTAEDCINICNDPEYLSPNVVDNITKKITALNTHITESVKPAHTLQQAAQAKQYIKEFARRRNLSLTIFPENFQEWLNEQVLSN